MATPQQVIQWFTSRHTLYGEMQAQKLAYYAQAWWLVWEGRPLFNEPIEAWQMGPVVPSLRHNVICRRTPAPDGVFTAADEINLEAIDQTYGHLGGAQLGQLTHQEDPWRITWGDRPTNGSGSDEIPLSLMRRFYALEALNGRGPVRRPVLAVEANPIAVERTAEAAATRWSRTLEILGQ